MDNVRIGMVGSGWMAKFYAESIVKYNHHVELIGVTGGKRAPKLAAEYDVEPIVDLDTMLGRDDVDALVMATPHQVHAEQVIAAAKSGKHILLEKPMAPNVPDCDAMISACKNGGVTLAMIKSLRYWNVMAKAKTLIEEGRIGDIRMIQVTCLHNLIWTATADNPLTDKPWALEPEAGGMILDRGCHIFDMLRWLTGDEVIRVFGKINSYEAKTYHTPNAMVQLEFSRGVMAQIWMGHEVPEPTFPDTGYQFRIWGERGLIDAEAHTVLKVSSNGEWDEIWRDPPRTEDWLEPWRLEKHFVQTQLFADNIRFNKPAAVSGEEGRAAIEIVQATHLSSMGGTSVNLPLPSNEGGIQFDGATVPRALIPGR